MHVEVVDLLPAIGAGVDERSKPVGDPQLPHQPRCEPKHTPQKRIVLRPHISQGGNVGFGDDEHMHWRPGVDVMKSQEFLIFMHLFGRDLTGHNLAEDAIRVCVHTGLPSINFNHPLTTR